jgi:class 3 adenylate cyclase/DNA-binding CsgD family transcriptional regulator/tetratricopeptide (TPR) repeat protein
MGLPRGTVTFLLSDVEGSTRRWEEAPEAMAVALGRSLALVEDAVTSHGGHVPVERGEGDGRLAAFERAMDALGAAIDIQRAHAAEQWPEGASLRVRIALHAADAVVRDERTYGGAAVHRAARLRELGRGGHILLSRAVHDLIADHVRGGLTLVDLGSHQLRDLSRPEQVFELRDPTLPAIEGGLRLRSPAQASSGGRAFVGRERALDNLLEGLDDAVARSGRVFLVGGEPGIGKTRLAEEFAARAITRGARVVWGRCWEAGGAPAYWPWIQSLRSLLANIDLDEIVALGGADPHLVQILPELQSRLPDLPDVSSVSPESARFDLFVAVSRLLESATRDQPLVVILEDLHSADASSLMLLRFVSESASEHRLVLMGTYRDIELTKDHPLTATLPELLRAPGAARVSLGGLTEPDVGRLIEAMPTLQSTPDLVATVHDKTDGNPLFVQEYLRLLDSERRLTQDSATGGWPIPEGVRDVIGRRLDHLSPSCIEMLTVASVAGREFAVEVLQRATGQDGDGVLGSLQDAISARLVEQAHDDPGRLRFAHALIRDTIYDQLPSSERCRRHAEVAAALESAFVADAGPFVAELAHHFFEAGPLGDQAKTLEYATIAGSRAVSSLAYEEAVRLFRMALRPLQDWPDERRRCEALVLLGDAQARAGDQSGSKESFLAAAAIATRIDDPELLARSAMGYGGRFPWARAGTDRELIPLLRRALDTLPTDDDPLRARLLARLAGALRDEPSPEPRSSLGAEAVAMARRIGDPDTLTYTLLGWWGAALMGPDERDRQQAVADELDELAHRTGDRELRCNAAWVRYHYSMTQADIWEARKEQALQAELAAELRQSPQRWYSGVFGTALALQDGRFAEARDLIGWAEAIGREAMPWDAHLSWLFAQFNVRREQGGLAGLEHELRGAVTTYAGYRSVRCMLVTLLLDAGRGNEARGLFEQLAIDDFPFPKDAEWLFVMSVLAVAAVDLDDLPRAAILYDKLVSYAGLVALAACETSEGPVDRPLGMLARALGRYDDAVRHFEDAIAICHRMGARPWAAHSEHAYAAMLAARNEPGDLQRAMERASVARDAAVDMSMTVLAARAEALLADLGARPTSADRRDVGLTRREQEVAALVAEGLSNRQIAEHLFVSERTAEAHLQHIFTKLGFSSRSQVAAWAVREGLDGPTT